VKNAALDAGLSVNKFAPATTLPKSVEL